MGLTLDQVKRVAKLAELPLGIDEEEKFLKQLAKILEYIKELSRVDTTTIPPTFNVIPEKHITAPDEVSASLLQDEALLNSTKKNDGFFLTKGIFRK